MYEYVVLACCVGWWWWLFVNQQKLEEEKERYDFISYFHFISFRCGVETHFIFSITDRSYDMMYWHLYQIYRVDIVWKA